ncbi:MAG: hypothetical protein QOH57_4411 [Mycobacterium sp.]|jgi:excisionase family DNA binding protein|nr:hypothetical protein [Mycobacterium sp.]
MMSRAIVPAEHLVVGLDGAGVLVSGSVCALLHRLLDLDRVRTQVRGQNPQLDQTLLAMRLAAIAATESSSTGTISAPQPEPVPSSKYQPGETVGTTTAAMILNMTDRAVRKAIAENRLRATQVDGRYRINRGDILAYQANRAS